MLEFSVLVLACLQKPIGRLLSGPSAADAPEGHSEVWSLCFYKLKYSQLIMEAIILSA